jgi:hypothetical protein
MLDYLYVPSKTLDIDTKTATALHFLGQYFEIRLLRWASRQYWINDLKLSNCHIYYEHAKVFQDEKILEAVAKTCRKNILDIKPSSPIVKTIDPDFWPRILENLSVTIPRMETVWLTVQSNINIAKQQSLHASCLVTESCKLNKESLDTDLFDALTDAKFLPHIDETCATDLLALHDFYRDVQDKQQATTTNKNTDLSSLQLRCVSAIAKNWRGLAVSANESTDFLKEQNPVVLAELLKLSLKHANSELEEEKRKVHARYQVGPWEEASDVFRFGPM